jgi:hypothetical protein
MAIVSYYISIVDLQLLTNASMDCCCSCSCSRIVAIRFLEPAEFACQHAQRQFVVAVDRTPQVVGRLCEFAFDVVADDLFDQFALQQYRQCSAAYGQRPLFGAVADITEGRFRRRQNCVDIVFDVLPQDDVFIDGLVEFVSCLSTDI